MECPAGQHRDGDGTDDAEIAWRSHTWSHPSDQFKASPLRELRQSWSQKQAGLTEGEVRQALVACLARDWPPTLPEFLRMCRPWLDPEVAHGIAVAGMAARRRGEDAMGVWPHPAVYWAAVAVGTHDLLSLTFGAIRTRWEAALREQRARGQWEPIPAPAPALPALPAPGATVTTNAEGARKAEALAAQAIEPEGKRRDPKAWAQRILAEQERKGGRRHTLAVLAMARRALDIEQEGSAA